MKVDLDKLLSYDGNKYIFSRAAMQAVEKISNVSTYDEDENKDEKSVITSLNYLLDEKIKFEHHFEDEK